MASAMEIVYPLSGARTVGAAAVRAAHALPHGDGRGGATRRFMRRVAPRPTDSLEADTALQGD